MCICVFVYIYIHTNTHAYIHVHLPTRGRPIAGTHLVRALALLLRKDHINDTSLEFAAVHGIHGVVRFVDVDEFNECKRLRPPVFVSACVAACCRVLQ